FAHGQMVSAPHGGHAPLDLKLTSTTTIGLMTSTSQPTALITGAGRGLGLALARSLLSGGWRVVVDARRAGHLAAALPGAVVVPGDVTDPAHRDALAAAVSGLAPTDAQRLDLLVNNASDLGP